MEETMQERIRKEIDKKKKNSGKTLKQISDEIEEKCGFSVSPATLSEMQNKADKGFDYRAIKAVAQYFGVSADYLLGLSPNRTTDAKQQAVCKYTGLSEDAVGVLSAAKKGSQYFNDFISCLVSLANTSRILIQLDNLSAETSILVQMYSFVGINSLEKMETLWDDTEEIEMGINGMKYVISRFLGNVIDEYSVSYTGLKDYAEFVNLKKGFSDDLLGRMTALYRKEEGGADEEH